MATTTRTWNDSDDAGYWDEQRRAIATPTDPAVALNTLRRKLSNISGSSDPALVRATAEYRARIAELEPVVAARTAATISAFEAREDAEWTREVTIERRAAWNAAVKGGRYLNAKGGVHVANLVKAMGFDAATLKRQVARHAL